MGVDEEEDAAVAGVLEQQVDHVALAQTVEELNGVGVLEALVELDLVGQIVPVGQGQRVLVDLVSALL